MKFVKTSLRAFSIHDTVCKLRMVKNTQRNRDFITFFNDVPIQQVKSKRLRKDVSQLSLNTVADLEGMHHLRKIMKDGVLIQNFMD